MPCGPDERTVELNPLSTLKSRVAELVQRRPMRWFVRGPRDPRSLEANAK